MRKTYPSDITREQFEKIQPILVAVRKTTKPRTVDLYDIFCAVLYVLKTGCQWNALPSDFPKRSNVHAHFMKWNEEEKVARKKQPSALSEVLKKISWRGPRRPWAQKGDTYAHP